MMTLGAAEEGEVLRVLVGDAALLEGFELGVRRVDLGGVDVLEGLGPRSV